MFPDIIYPGQNFQTRVISFPLDQKKIGGNKRHRKVLVQLPWEQELNIGEIVDKTERETRKTIKNASYYIQKRERKNIKISRYLKER